MPVPSLMMLAAYHAQLPASFNLQETRFITNTDNRKLFISMMATNYCMYDLYLRAIEYYIHVFAGAMYAFVKGRACEIVSVYDRAFASYIEDMPYAFRGLPDEVQAFLRTIWCLANPLGGHKFKACCVAHFEHAIGASTTMYIAYDLLYKEFVKAREMGVKFSEFIAHPSKDRSYLVTWNSRTGLFSSDDFCKSAIIAYYGSPLPHYRTTCKNRLVPREEFEELERRRPVFPALAKRKRQVRAAVVRSVRRRKQDTIT